jgi:cytochrome c
MRKHSIIYFLLVAGISALAWLQDNSAPTVKIIAPVNHGYYAENTAIPFRINVSDKEDGETQYDEIPSIEVVLEVRYIPDTTAARSQSLSMPTTVRTSNCLNCHAFNAKLIGPSFIEIGEKYTASQNDVETLSTRVIEGSTGVWGNVVMPSHPEIKMDEAKKIVSWIIKSASDKNVNYYSGTTGSFRIQSPDPKGKSAFLITASYTDHGLPDVSDSKKSGQATVMIHVK